MDIDTVNVVADDNAAAGIGGNNDIVDAADLIAPEANGAGAQTEAPQADVPDQGKTEERRFTSDEMSRAVQQRLKQERRGAAYQLGREILNEYMAANNIRNEADALAKIREDRIKSKAAAFKADPQKGFEEMLRMQNQPTEPAEETRTAKAGNVDQIYSELSDEIKTGKVPQGFDIVSYLSEPERARTFLRWREKLGVEEACNIAMQIMTPATPTKAEINRSLPKSIHTNNSYQPANIDYTKMTSEEFAAAEKRIRQARAQGKRVR